MDFQADPKPKAVCTIFFILSKSEKEPRCFVDGLGDYACTGSLEGDILSRVDKVTHLNGYYRGW